MVAMSFFGKENSPEKTPFQCDTTTFPVWGEIDQTKVIVFDESQEAQLGVKVIERNYLIGQNFELKYNLKELEEERDGLLSQKDMNTKVIAQLEADIRLLKGQVQFYEDTIRAKDKEIKSLEKSIKWQKFKTKAAAVVGVAVGVAVTVLVFK